MIVRLLTDPAPAATGINVLGMESIELRHVEYLHLELEQAMATAGGEKTEGSDKNVGPPGPAGGNGKPETTPIAVCCQGPFRFDAAQHVATFRDDVQVTRLNPGGPPDQISCQLLSLYFSARKAAPPAPEARHPPTAAGSGPGPARRRWGCAKAPPAVRAVVGFARRAARSARQPGGAHRPQPGRHRSRRPTCNIIC